MMSPEPETSHITLQTIAELIKSMERRINEKIQTEVENIDRREAKREALYI